MMSSLTFLAATAFQLLIMEVKQHGSSIACTA
jgi:hypothetical protein